MKVKMPAPFDPTVFYRNLGLPRSRVAQVAKNLNVPLAFTENQLWMENKGRSDKDSPAGAKGVAQMMDPTWRGLQKNYPDAGLVDPRDPEQALTAYELLMKENIKRAGGDILKAAQAYHGGWDPKDYGPYNEMYVDYLRPHISMGVQPNPMKQQEMVAEFNKGIGNPKSVQEFASGQAPVTPIASAYRQGMSGNQMAQNRPMDPLNGMRNYTTNPITYEALARYIGLV